MIVRSASMLCGACQRQMPPSYAKAVEVIAPRASSRSSSRKAKAKRWQEATAAANHAPPALAPCATSDHSLTYAHSKSGVDNAALLVEFKHEPVDTMCRSASEMYCQGSSFLLTPAIVLVAGLGAGQHHPLYSFCLQSVRCLRSNLH